MLKFQCRIEDLNENQNKDMFEQLGKDWTQHQHFQLVLENCFLEFLMHLRKWTLHKEISYKKTNVVIQTVVSFTTRSIILQFHTFSVCVSQGHI